MSGDPESILQEQRRHAEARRELQSKSTLEVVEMERNRAPLPEWQQYMVNGLALVGVLAIVYLVFSVLFS